MQPPSSSLNSVGKLCHQSGDTGSHFHIDTTVGYKHVIKGVDVAHPYCGHTPLYSLNTGMLVSGQEAALQSAMHYKRIQICY